MHASHLHTTGAATQRGRFPSALTPEHVVLDERSLAELIAFAPAFAPLLRYYDLRNEAVGDWSAFFRHDLTVLLAEMATFDVNRNHYLFLRLSRKYREDAPEVASEETEADHRTVVALLGTLIRQVQDWSDRARHLVMDNQVAVALQEVLATSINKQFVQASRSQSDLYGLLREKPHSLVWHRQGLLAMIRRQEMAREARAAIQALLPQIKELNTDVRNLANLARQYLPDSLSENVHHPPHVALYLVFVQLLRHVQEQLNTLPAEHLDHYYRDILQLKERPAQPDAVHVILHLAPDVPVALLEKGTRLVAGKDAQGVDILYATQEAVALTQTRLAALKTLYLPRQSHGEGQTHSKERTQGWVRRAVIAPVANSADGLGQPVRDPLLGWPTFGAVADLAGVDPARFPAMGFVVASPMLLLREGERTVTLTLSCTVTAEHTPVAEYLQALKATYEPGTHTFEEKDSLRPPSDCLKVYLSSAKGWVTVPDYTMRIRTEAAKGPCEIELSWCLGADEPAIVAAQPEVLGEDYPTPWPLCKIVLNPQARVYPYALFRDLLVTRAQVDVAVEGLRTLYPQNETGPVDARQPFPPFGATPRPGSYLLFGNKELFQKPLTALDLTLDWFNLAQVDHDLRAYYSAYGQGTTADSFQVQPSRRVGVRWIPYTSDGKPKAPLFQQLAPSEPTLCETTRMTVDLPALPPQHGAALTIEEPLVFSSQTASHFFRLTLSDPAYGFGQDLYPKLVAKTVAENAPDPQPADAPATVKVVKPLPNLPFLPILRTLTASYTARHVLRLPRKPGLEDASADQVFQIGPFGQRPCYGASFPCVPAFDEEGYLYLGLRNLVVPQTLRLLFQLSEQPRAGYYATSKPDISSTAPRLAWQYLARNAWHPFPAKAVTSDTTNQFARSGIVTLEVPEGLTDDNTLLPAGLHWIRVGIAAGAAQVAHTIAVHTQALRVVRVMNSAAAPPGGALPPSSITKLATPTPAVAEILQPYPSSGYRPAEQEQDYRTRVSERLRHKQRAVQSWDYERLVLDRFPQLGTVLCVTHNRAAERHGNLVAPGEVVVAVVPRRDVATVFEEPQADAAILHEVADYLRGLTPGFVRQISVCNPAYEYVKVRAHVTFTPGTDQGYGLSRLQEEVYRYIAPWWYDPAASMKMGQGILYRGKVHTFMMQRPYVARVLGVSLEHVYRNGEAYLLDDTARKTGTAQQAVRAFLPWSVLVPFRDQAISVAANDEVAVPPEQTQIGNLVIGSDFVLSGDASAGPTASTPTASNPTGSNPTGSNPTASNPTASNPTASNPTASSAPD